MEAEVCRRSRGKCESGECLRVRIEPAEPVANPDRSAAVLQQVLNKITAKRVRVPRVMSVLLHPVAVVAVQARLCTEPKESVTVLQDGENGIVRKSIGGRNAIEPYPRLQRAGAWSAAARSLLRIRPTEARKTQYNNEC